MTDGLACGQAVGPLCPGLVVVAGCGAEAAGLA